MCNEYIHMINNILPQNLRLANVTSARNSSQNLYKMKFDRLSMLMH